jgi:hypothetical protein
MRRSKRTTAALGLAFGCLGAALSAHAVMAQPIQRPAAAAGSIGVDVTRQCLAEQDDQRLAVLFLVDESKSMQTADAGDLRVTAIRGAISKLGLNLLAVEGDASRSIDVKISVFATAYQSLGDWIRLSPDTTSLLAQVDELASRDSAADTDYEAGLEGAEREFVEYERANGRSCKVLVWLSDGVIDLQGSDKTADQRSFEGICSPSGVASRLRNQGIFAFGIGLSTNATAPTGTFGQMAQIVEGTRDCGSFSEGSSGTSVGQFIESPDAAKLAEAFSSLFPGDAPTPPICDPNPGTTACREFVLSVGAPTAQVRLVVAVPNLAGSVALVAPDLTETVIYENGTFVSSPAANVAVEVFGNQTARVRLDVGAQSYGRWGLRIQGEQADFSSVSLFSDARPKFGSEVPLRLERDVKPARVAVTLNDPDLAGIAMGAVDGTPGVVAYTIEATSTFGSQQVPVTVAGGASGAFQLDLGADLSALPAQGTLIVEPSATVDGVPVLFADASAAILVTSGDAFPQLAGKATATDIDADYDGKKTSMISVSVLGPKDSGKKVASARITDTVKVLNGPPGVEIIPALVVSAGSEAELAVGDERTIVATLDPKGQKANGTLTVEVVVILTSVQGDEQKVPLVLEISMAKPFETGTFIGLLILMAVIFVLVQVAVVWPYSRYIARVRGLSVRTRVVTGDIVISNTGRITGANGPLDTLAQSAKVLPTAVKPALVSDIKSFTFRGFPGMVYRGLLNPKRIETFAKRDSKDPTEISIGHRGVRKIGGHWWGQVSPNLNDSWVVSVKEAEVWTTVNNPNRDLTAHLLFILPESSRIQPSQIAATIERELGRRGIRRQAAACLSDEPVAKTTGEGGSGETKTRRRGDGELGDGSGDSPRGRTEVPDPERPSRPPKGSVFD